MVTGKRIPNSQGKLTDFGNFRDQDWYSAGNHKPYYREYPPKSQRGGYDQYNVDINGNRYSKSGSRGSSYHRSSRDSYGRYGDPYSSNQMSYYDNQYSSQSKDPLYHKGSSYLGGTDKNYNQYSSSRYASDYLGGDSSYRRYGDDSRSPMGRHRSYSNNNRSDMMSWKDPSHDRRRRKDHYYGGDRELPSTPVLGRRHSWDAYDENGYSRGN